MRIALLSFCVFSLGYLALVEFWQPTINVWEDQENANYVRAEKLLYGESTPPAVFAGSSLIAEMRYFLDDNELFILSQQGGSALEGVELLVQSGIRPEVLFVELNALTVQHRDEFAESFSQGVFTRLAGWFPAFRVEYRPVNVLLNLARNTLGSGGPPPGAPRGDPWGALPTPEIDPTDEAYLARIANLSGEYQNPPDDTYIENLALLSEFLERLTSDGVRVVLVELPVHPDLIETPYHQERRRLLRTALREHEWIDWSQGIEGIVFADGIHFPLITSRELSQRLLQK